MFKTCAYFIHLSDSLRGLWPLLDGQPSVVKRFVPSVKRVEMNFLGLVSCLSLHNSVLSARGKVIRYSPQKSLLPQNWSRPVDPTSITAPEVHPSRRPRNDACVSTSDNSSSTCRRDVKAHCSSIIQSKQACTLIVVLRQVPWP